MNDCVDHGTPSASCTVRSAELKLREITGLLGSRAHRVKLFLQCSDMRVIFAHLNQALAKIKAPH